MPSCPTCGDSFETQKQVNYHHYPAHGESIAIEESTCVDCGELFEYYPSDKEGMYCEGCVDNSWGNDNLVIGFGEDNNNWNGGKPQVECSFCGDLTAVSRYNYREYENHFCLDECQRKFMSEKRSGEGNPRYIDGEHRQRSYGKGWKRAKRKALKRDQYRCVVCSRDERELNRKPAVHHKTPVRTFKDPIDAHYLENLVCLCPKHHQEVEVGNRKI